MITCNCPAAASLTTIPAVSCPESFGQIQKVAFQRLYSAAGVKNKFTTSQSTAQITLKASWTPLLSATDGTKVVVSPYVEAPTSEPGGPRTFGGGNETLGGVETIIGREPTTFSGVIRSVPQSVIKAMKDLQCEAVGDNLGVFLFDENGNIECLADGSGNHYPIPVRALFVSDKGHGGLEAPDSNTIQWSFLPNYSDDLVIVAPSDFNPLTDLQ